MEFEAKYNVQNTLFSLTITEKDMIIYTCY